MRAAIGREFEDLLRCRGGWGDGGDRLMSKSSMRRWPATVWILFCFIAGREGRCVQAAARCAILSLSP